MRIKYKKSIYAYMTINVSSLPNMRNGIWFMNSCVMRKRMNGMIIDIIIRESIEYLL